MRIFVPMNPPLRRIDRVLSLTWVAVQICVRPAVGQTSAELEIQTYAGLTVSGEVGKIYSVEYVTDLSHSNDASAWRCLEFLQLPASPYLWADKSAPATANRLYRAVAMEAPTNMVFIPPGTFRMGSPEHEVDRYYWEGPQTDAIISRGFWMGKYEVTQGEYVVLKGQNPSYFNGQRIEGGGNVVDYGADLSRPVETLRWYDATDYCSLLTQREITHGRIPAHSAYRLPTEAEWEYACRGWTSTRFSYGDDPGYTNLANYAWYGDNDDFQTHPVGQKLPNLWGLYDMHGHVWEWCQDWFGDYAGGSAVDPAGPATGSHRVVRSGYWYGWSGGAWYCRAAGRSAEGPGNMGRHFGFRVVLAPSQP
jgi:formylglycine-generating enzyme required for sulfatase activity